MTAEAFHAFLPRPWGRMAYSDEGGGLPVFLLHGYGGDRHQWNSIWPLLRAFRRIAPDWIGHGESTLPKAPPRLRDLVADVIALADHLWLNRFAVVGHSLGGMVGLRMAMDHADRLLRLALVEAFPTLAHSRRVSRGLTEATEPAVAARVEETWRDNLVCWRPGIRETFTDWLESCDGHAVIESAITPCLALVGDRGRPRPPAEAIGFGGAGADLVWLAGEGHYPHMSRPVEVAAHLVPFLAGGDGRARPEPPGSDRPPPTLDDLALGLGR